MTRPLENVRDYPRPPALEPSSDTIIVEFGGREIARTSAAFRVLETFHPPTYYLPKSAFAEGVLVPVAGSSFCEWKGQARYFDVIAGSKRAERAAWSYDRPTAGFAAITGYIALYPGRMDRCTVDGETVSAQPGDFYGGWVTSWITGPIKGAPGTRHW